MRIQKISFPNQQVLCVFPSERSELEHLSTELLLKESYPVIVLIGGDIDDQEAVLTRKAIETISQVAEEIGALVICGGTEMGVMAEIGQIRQQKRYNFPLLGIAPEELVTWPDGPRSTKFLWWGKKRWPLEPHYSHFILVPGSHFGDESSWIVDTATMLSQHHQSLTILINGGNVSRNDIKLSLENSRPVLALSRTGRLADELARQPGRDKLITVIPANAEQRIVEVMQEMLSANKAVFLTRSAINAT